MLKIDYIAGSFPRAGKVRLIDSKEEALLIVKTPRAAFLKVGVPLFTAFAMGLPMPINPNIQGSIALGLIVLSVVILKGTKTKYPLNSGIAYCEAAIHETSKTKRSWGGTLGKIVLLGAAGAAANNRLGFLAGSTYGAANLVNTEKTTTNEFVVADVYFMDGNHIKGKTSEVAANLLMYVAIFDDSKDFLRLKRMEQDAQRVLPEVQADAENAAREFERLTDIAEHGETFNQREDAKNEAPQAQNIAHKKNVLFEHLQKKVQQALAPPDTSLSKSFLAFKKNYWRWSLGAVAVIIIFFLFRWVPEQQGIAPSQTIASQIQQQAAPAVEQAKSEADKINELRNAAEHGDAQAQFNMGEAYRYGNSVQQDDTQASTWYQKSADQGNALAKNALADIEAQREQDSSEEGEGDVRQQSNAKSQGNPTTDAQQGACKPYTTPDGTKSGIACKQKDGTWKIKTSIDSTQDRL